MLIISVTYNEIRDEKEMQKQTNKDRNEQGGEGRSYSERVRRAQ